MYDDRRVGELTKTELGRWIDDVVNRNVELLEDLHARPRVAPVKSDDPDRLHTDGNSAWKFVGGHRVLVDIQDVDVLSTRLSVSLKVEKDKSVPVQVRANSKLIGRRILERKLGRPIKPKLTVDHRNHDPLDNRRANLAESTRSDNNKRRRTWGSSRYWGVSFYKPMGMWRAMRPARLAKRHKQPLHIGYFLTQEDAARAVDSAVLKLAPRARTNVKRGLLPPLPAIPEATVQLELSV